MAVGAGREEVSKDFDRYWASDSAYPAIAVLRGDPAGQATLPRCKRVGRCVRDPAARAYLERATAHPIRSDCCERRLAFEWTTTRML